MNSKEYKFSDGRTAVFEYDENGIGKITLECVDALMNRITQQWIPVSDHLPEKNGEYLVTVGKDSRFAFNGEATVYEDTFYSLCQWDDCGEDVIAWMEMPEPYTEEEQ